MLTGVKLLASPNSVRLVSTPFHALFWLGKKVTGSNLPMLGNSGRRIADIGLLSGQSVAQQQIWTLSKQSGIHLPFSVKSEFAC